MGGVAHEAAMTSGPSERIAEEARRAIEATNGKGFLLAPGCSIDPETPEANLRALVEAARS
jgi:uroporphyrinogen-III decarboxylase